MLLVTPCYISRDSWYNESIRELFNRM